MRVVYMCARGGPVRPARRLCERGDGLQGCLSSPARGGTLASFSHRNGVTA
ncbi:MAG: hypothetical protein MZV64_70630 [Ignavibacteriales bacterium]|nr:hypothetical protein [Ignavibacteriales bacterium]